MLEVDDVDVVVFGEDEVFYFGVLVVGLVVEVDIGVEELVYGYDGYDVFFCGSCGILYFMCGWFVG